MTDNKYPERLCAFVDILGFRELINRLRTDYGAVIRLRDILNRVHKPKADSLIDIHVKYGVAIDGGLASFDYRTQSISDAVAISVIPTAVGLLALFRSLEALAVDLLSEGFMLRGGIARGALYHDDSMIFGDALLGAYDLESRVARYPRIIVKRNVFDMTTTAHISRQLDYYTHSSADGPSFVHILRSMQMEMDGMGSKKIVPWQDVRFERYHAIARILASKLNEARDNPAHFEKILWFIKYWNKSLPENADNFRLRLSHEIYD